MKTLNAGNLLAKKKKIKKKRLFRRIAHEQREFLCRAARPNLSFSQVFREFPPAALLSSLVLLVIFSASERGRCILAGLVSSRIFQQIIFAQNISIRETEMHQKRGNNYITSRWKSFFFFFFWDSSLLSDK